MFEKLSPVPWALLSCRYPRPHEGLSRVVLKVRAGSGACGWGPPNPGLGRLSRNGGCRRFPSRCRTAGAASRSISSDPHGIVPRENRLSGTMTGRQGPEFEDIAAATDGDGSESLRFTVMRDATDRNRRHEAPGDRCFLKLGTAARRPCPLGCFSRTRWRAAAMTHAL
jgi:hypothetical protein